MTITGMIIQLVGHHHDLATVRIESAGGIDGTGYRYAGCDRAPCVYWIGTLVVGPSHGRILPRHVMIYGPLCPKWQGDDP